MTLKETRVYSVKHLKEFTPEQLSKVIRSSIRPWSWRSQINELGEQLKLAASHVSPAAVSSLMKSGVQLTTGVVPIQVAKVPDANDAPECKTCDATPAAETPMNWRRLTSMIERSSGHAAFAACKPSAKMRPSMVNASAEAGDCSG